MEAVHWLSVGLQQPLLAVFSLRGTSCTSSFVFQLHSLYSDGGKLRGEIPTTSNSKHALHFSYCSNSLYYSYYCKTISLGRIQFYCCFNRWYQPMISTDDINFLIVPISHCGIKEWIQMNADYISIMTRLYTFDPKYNIIEYIQMAIHGNDIQCLISVCLVY